MKFRNKKTGEIREWGPVLINSALLSAQQRKRYYWTNWHVEQPQDKGILLKDILESGQSWKEKSPCIDACYYKGGNFTSPQKQSGQRNMVAEPAVLRYERTETAKKLRKDYESHKIHHGFNEFRVLRPRPDNKSNTLSTVLKDNMVAEPIPCAMRTREDELGKFKRVETKDDGKANSLTSVQTDSMVAERIAEVVSQISSRDFELSFQKNGNIRPNKGDPKKTGIGEAPTIYSIENKAGTIIASHPVYVHNMAPERIGTIGKGGQAGRIYSIRGKSVCLGANGGGGGAKTGLYKVDLPDGDYIIRKLTPVECERLQTLPDNYTAGVSNTQRYKAIGNGWTVDVIAWIFSQLPKD